MRKALYFLGTLSDSDLDWLVETGDKRRLAPGQLLVQEATRCDALYFVLEGTLQVTVAALGDDEIARLGMGDIVGEMSFVDSRPTSATVKAAGDCTVLAIPRQSLERKLEEVDFAARFYRTLAVFLADRLRSTVYRFGDGRVPLDSRAVDDVDEIDPAVLERMTLAGARLNWLLHRLQHV